MDAPLLAGTGHAVHDVPHVAGELSATHTPLHRWKPALHAKPHTPAVQVAVALAGAGAHAVHDAPHVSGSASLTHAPAHRWKPALHAKPHTLAVHVGVALATLGQIMPQAPQFSGSVVGSTQLVPQASGAGDTHEAMHDAVVPTIWHKGAAPEHASVHEPQVAGKARFASQPFVGFVSQSAKPTLHVKPHTTPLHDATAFAAAGQVAHPAVPQVATSLLLTHAPPQSWKPALHASEHTPARHVAVAFARAVHAVHAAPHSRGSVSAAQTPAQS